MIVIKRIFSAVLSLIIIFTCCGISTVTAFAQDSEQKAQTSSEQQEITLSSSVTIGIDSNSSNKNKHSVTIRFVAPATKYYEFVCDAVPDTGYVSSVVIPSDKNENCLSGTGIGGNVNGKKYDKFIVAAKLTKGKTYYVNFAGNKCGEFIANVTVRAHSHKYDKAYVIPAYVDDACKVYDDGGKWQPCLYCGAEKTIEIYYTPKTVILSVASCYYRGTARVPKVTVKDRKGNVISSSDYKVTCKNNVKPGKATVIVNLNSDKYGGTITSHFIIRPNSMAAPKVSSPKSQQLKVNWIRNGNVDGYYVQYSTSSKFQSGSSTKGVFISKYTIGSTTVSKLQPGKKYYVRMRAFKTIDGKNYHGTWSKVSAVTIKK